MYDKGNNLRIEVTVNNPKDFKIPKEKEKVQDGKVVKSMEWVPMGKSIANLYRYVEISRAVIKRYLVVMPDIPMDKVPEKEVLAVSAPKELFMQYAKDSYPYYFFAVMLRTGLRSGEMRGLKYTDIKSHMQEDVNGRQRMDYKILQVCRTLKYIDGQGYIEDSPKTRTSIRDIPLTEDTQKC